MAVLLFERDHPTWLQSSTSVLPFIVKILCTEQGQSVSYRNQETVNYVNEFLESIKGLKVSRQKQKIGEKIFKVLKTRAPAMRNISKRTVTVLDTADVNALLHLSDEFPDILLARLWLWSSRREASPTVVMARS